MGEHFHTGVEGEVCNVGLTIKTARPIAEVGGAKSGGVAKQKNAGHVGKLTQVSPSPLPQLLKGRVQWCG